MLPFILLLSITAAAFAGTQCPPRSQIYPCSCLALPQAKKVFFTTVTCHRLHSTDSLLAIMPALRAMAIDHFYIYDSFWDANKEGTSEGENKQVLPTDWMTLLKIKEFEIVDTSMSSCFACHSRLTCRNSFTTRFTAVNSSSHEKICTLCDTDTGNKFSWTGCLSKLRQFHFTQGKLTVVRPDLFPQAMRELTEVDLSYNQITKVEARAFSNVPRLKILDLSHNALQSLESMFTGQSMQALEKVDVSWNLIKTIGSDFISSVPSLKTLNADNNFIVELKEKEWEKVGEKLRLIELKENPLHCDCNIRWVNETFHISVVLDAHCATPEDYENSPVRRASRMLIERCDADGNIGTRKNTKKVKATTPSF